MPLPPDANPHATWWPVVATEPDDVYHGIIFQKRIKAGEKKTSQRAVEHVIVKALDPTLFGLIHSGPPRKRRRLLSAPRIEDEEDEVEENEDQGEDRAKLKEQPQQQQH